jgi:hypothetical protein
MEEELFCWLIQKEGQGKVIEKEGISKSETQQNKFEMLHIGFHSVEVGSRVTPVRQIVSFFPNSIIPRPRHLNLKP